MGTVHVRMAAAVNLPELPLMLYSLAIVSSCLRAVSFLLLWNDKRDKQVLQFILVYGRYTLYLYTIL